MSPELKQFLIDLEDEAGFADEAIGVNARSQVGDTPLHIASIKGDVQIVNQLLDCGAEIDAAGEDGYTALHYAVEQEKIAVVKVLVDRGCDSNRRFFDGEGETASELAGYIKDEAIKSQIVHILNK